jgi:phosphoribosylformylglycinamidine synthase subunit PurQ / glutaminase
MRERRPRSLVLFGNGINCEYETSHANRLAGFQADVVHINRLMEDPAMLHRYSFLNFPGGFLDGDDLGAAKAQAVKWRYETVSGTGTKVIDELRRFIDEGKIIIGICNGFQLLVKIGLIPATDGAYGGQSVTLTRNDSGKFEDRWVYLKVNPDSPCIFTPDIDRMYLPVRHGEGKLVVQDQQTLKILEERRHIVACYADSEGSATSSYPENPNGSVQSIAALCDVTGRVFGLMPHPEAFVHFTQHPRWTRESLPEEGEGLKIFRNAYRYVVEHL